MAHNPITRSFTAVALLLVHCVAAANYQQKNNMNLKGTQDDATCTTEPSDHSACHDYDQCKALCDEKPECLGFVVHPWGANWKLAFYQRCWVTRSGFTSYIRLDDQGQPLPDPTTPNPDAQTTTALTTSQGATTTTSTTELLSAGAAGADTILPTWVSLGKHTACRQDSQDKVITPPHTISSGKTLDDCKRYCQANADAGCTAIEFRYSQGRCELRSVAIKHVVNEKSDPTVPGDPDFECFSWAPDCDTVDALRQAQQVTGVEDTSALEMYAQEKCSGTQRLFAKIEGLVPERTQDLSKPVGLVSFSVVVAALSLVVLWKRMSSGSHHGLHGSMLVASVDSGMHSDEESVAF
eukprot:TRINITY_DN40992_c0_g1_i1.p1 TRINITY_DN40992_c0_g1~~TRINITY_DN40992_c0_g1_i1.p1  ORF type:complete len:352 (+),score=32.42 TRINITY_DN40992_c0_g1_i1:51-1106(+)